MTRNLNDSPDLEYRSTMPGLPTHTEQEQSLQNFFILRERLLPVFL